MQTIIIADDHPFTLMGTRSFVDELGYKVLDLCSNGIAAYNSIMTRQPDIALLDMSMPGMNAIEILEKLNRQSLQTKVVLLTMHNELSIFHRARELGIKGYVLKELAAQELGDCLKAVVRGHTWFSTQLDKSLVMDSKSVHPGLELLTASERKIIALIAQQHNSKAIAGMLFITEKTVENHRSNIVKKLNLPPEKNALLKWAIKNGIGG